MGFRKIGYPQVMVGFNTTMVAHDLDDLGYPPDLETSMWVCDDIIAFGYFCLLYLLFKEQCVYCYLLYYWKDLFIYTYPYIGLLVSYCPMRTRLQSWGIVGAKK